MGNHGDTHTLPLGKLAAELATRETIAKWEFLNLVGFTLNEDQLREVLEQVTPPRDADIRRHVADAINEHVEVYDPAEVVREWLDTPPKASRFFLTLEDIRDRPVPQYLYEDMILERGLHLLAGAAASFKTFQALNIAIGVASTGRRVAYFLNEGVDVVPARVAARCRHLAVAEPPIAFHIETRHLVNDAALIVQQVTAHFRAADLLIFDTLRRSTVGLDEDKSGDFARIVAACDFIREQTGAALLLVDHTGHTKTRARGTSAKYDSVDVALVMERQEGTSYVTLKCQKSKGAEEFKPRAYHLATTEHGPVLLPENECAPSPASRREQLVAAFGTAEFTTSQAAEALELSERQARNVLNDMPELTPRGGTRGRRWRFGSDPAT